MKEYELRLKGGETIKIEAEHHEEHLDGGLKFYATKDGSFKEVASYEPGEAGIVHVEEIG